MLAQPKVSLSALLYAAMAQQESFPELNPAEFDVAPVVESGEEQRKPERAAIARVAHEDFWDPEHAKAILDTPPDPNAFFAAQPNVLRRELMSVERRFDGNYYNGVLFSPQEHEKLVRSPGAFADKIRGKTHIARQADPSFDRRVGKAQRSPLHALEGKIIGLEKLSSVFEREYEYLDWIRRELRAPGFAHTDEYNLRVIAAQAKEHWVRVFDVVAVQQNWEGDKRQAVLDAMEYSSVGSRRVKGSYHKAVGYWRDMTQLSCQYAVQKRNTINKNLSHIQRYLDTL